MDEEYINFLARYNVDFDTVLRVVNIDGSISHDSKTIKEMLDDDYSIVLITESVVFMKSPYLSWNEAFLIDRGVKKQW